MLHFTPHLRSVLFFPPSHLHSFHTPKSCIQLINSSLQLPVLFSHAQSVTLYMGNELRNMQKLAKLHLCRDFQLFYIPLFTVRFFFLIYFEASKHPAANERRTMAIERCYGATRRACRGSNKLSHGASKDDSWTMTRIENKKALKSNAIDCRMHAMGNWVVAAHALNVVFERFYAFEESSSSKARERELVYVPARLKKAKQRRRQSIDSGSKAK